VRGSITKEHTSDRELSTSIRATTSQEKHIPLILDNRTSQHRTTQHDSSEQEPQWSWVLTTTEQSCAQRQEEQLQRRRGSGGTDDLHAKGKHHQRINSPDTGPTTANKGHRAQGKHNS